MKPTKRATRRASEESYNKREARYDKREANMRKRGASKEKIRKFVGRTINKEMRILKKANK